MAGAVTSHNPAEQRRCCCLVPANDPIRSALGYGILSVFTTLSFSGGALFGLTSWACDRALNWIYTKADINQNNTIANVVKFALRFFAHVGVGMLVLGAAGCPITFGCAVFFATAAYVIMPYFVASFVYSFRTLSNVIGVESEG